MTIAWALTEEQDLLRRSLERLLADHYPIDHRRAVAAGETGHDPAMWRRLAELGLLAVPFRNENGGLGGTLADVGIVMETFGAALVSEPFINTAIVCGHLIEAAGTAEQRTDLIGRIIAGELIVAAALYEHGSADAPAHVTTRATATADGYVIKGAKGVVYDAPFADLLIVSARTAGGATDRDGISLFAVDPRASGVERQDYRTVDGHRAAEIRFDSVAVTGDALIGTLGMALPHIEAALDRGALALMAENVGAMARLNAMTREHLRTRVAFGQPLAGFQALQHRTVEMATAETMAGAAVLMATAGADARLGERAVLVSAAKVQLAPEARFVAQNALHLHGAMGMTDELDVGLYLKRLTVSEALFGRPRHHLQRYLALASDDGRLHVREYVMPLDPRLAAFREEVDAFLEHAVTEDMRIARRRTMWMLADFAASKTWQETLEAQGWGAPHWPVEHGGTGWSAQQQAIWETELARFGAPVSAAMMGTDLLAPVVMRYGSPELKATLLPRLRAGQDWWAQGFSEPGAGSDLAALSLAAVSDGDDYVLNGSKIWSTFAHVSTHFFMLARTGRGERKQQGITFLLVDLATPGIEVRPIINVAGEHEFNEVFFTDVRVPKSQRLGEEGEGWAVTRNLLEYEHAIAWKSASDLLWRLGWLQDIYAAEGEHLDADAPAPSAAARDLAEVAIEVQIAVFVAQWNARCRDSGTAGIESPLLGGRLRECGMRMTELALEAIGPHAAVFGAEAERAAAAPHVEGVTRFYLTQRATVIAGGTPEIHRNNLARQLMKQ